MNTKIKIALVIVLVLLLGIGYYIVFKEDKDTTLNLLEKQWIESNKNTVIDMGIVNEIPVFNYNGNGVFFDFLNDLENNTGLSFNLVPFVLNENKNINYSFNIVDNITKDDILIYKDNYVLLTKDKKIYNELDDINNLVIGVLNSDLNNVNLYLKGNNLSLKTYEDINSLLKSIEEVEVTEEIMQVQTEKDDAKVDAIVLPKLIYLENIIKLKNINITYNITEMEKNFVLSLGNNDKLNNILIKYYKKWAFEQFDSSFQKYFNSNYFSFKSINEKDQVNFRSKRYVYGFIENLPFDYLINDVLYGYNSAFIKKFSNISNIEVIYQKYKNFDDLFKAINTNQVDFIIDFNEHKYSMDVAKTIGLYENNYVIISSLDNNIVINSLNSIKDKEVLTVKNTYLENFLNKNDIKVKSFDNIIDLLNSKKEKDIMVINKDSYKFYQSSQLKNYKVDYEDSLDNNYGFIARDIKENQIFINYFDFYLSFLNNKEIINSSYYDLITDYEKPDLKNIIYLVSAGFVTILIVIFTIIRFKKIKNKKVKIVTKEDKLKYIDLLTSLKNRNYLNDNIEKWDDSEIYPQAIVVVDLNNVAYINDNYGHSEGDNVIREAANILIQNQEENSDIIRTSGNEFLIYLVGHDEKSIINYKRKLAKEFKNLSYNFGAAIGYSMILDGIKTIDDAINEATLDMRDNKDNSV